MTIQIWDIEVGMRHKDFLFDDANITKENRDMWKLKQNIVMTQLHYNQDSCGFVYGDVSVCRCEFE